MLREHFVFFAEVNGIYEARFLQPLWQKYSPHEDDDWKALAIFLEGYAFARQGAPANFGHAACDAIQECRNAGLLLTDVNAAQEIWDRFSAILKANLNYAVNPLCPGGISYERRYKGKTITATTHNMSVVEFLSALAKENKSANIITWAKKGLQEEKTRDIHKALSGINGIGDKIASFFFRDVASFYSISPLKYRYLVQPIDVWIRRISKQLMNLEPVDEEIAKWIVEEATKDNVTPEAVSQGMWYFGSQIAGSEYRVSKALDNLGYANSLINEHMEALRQAALSWGKK